MQAEKLFAVLQAHSCTQSRRMKSDSWVKSPLPTTSRAHQEGAAAAGSVVQVRSKTTIGRGTECRGQIQDLHHPESWVHRSPEGAGPCPARGAATPWDRVLSGTRRHAHHTSTLKLIPGQANADGVLLEYFSP